jgi:uncharacterized protein YjbI with pentapeptide repeats
MKFQIKSRWSSKIVFEAELAASFETKSNGERMGQAVRDAVLRDAVLSGAVLRGAVLRDAVLRDAVLRDADLSGADLSDADLSGADLSGADLRGAVLRDAVLRDAVLSGAVLRDADLSGAVLRDADLSGADLSGAVLRDAVLRDADLRDAVLSGALAGVPFIKDIHQTVYQAASVPPEALDMSTWHKCETTHCRAGWVVTLAGAGGKALEWAIGTPAAAAIIYMKSDPKLKKIPNFYASNADALADMKRLADEEKARAAKP